MSQKNEIAVAIPKEDLDKILAAVGVLETSLLPHLTNLNGQEKLEMPKMGEKTVSFVQKATDYCLQNKELVPSYLDVAALQEDLAAVKLFSELSKRIAPLSAAVEDSLLLSGSEAYQAALLFYGSVKAAAKGKAPKASKIYEDLSVRFPGARAKRKAAT